MQIYQYKSVDNEGRVNVGKVDAVNVADLEARLGKMGLDLINYKDLGTSGPKSNAGGVSRRDLITYCFHLEQTSRAGVPIIDSLIDLRDSTDNPRLKEVIAAMTESIEGGKTLSASMRDYPGVFTRTMCSLVGAGEQSGQMAEVFYNIGENLKWQDEQAAQTRKLLMYPLFVGTVVTGVVFFLMIYLVPKLISFVKTMGQELPLHTKALIFVSDIFINYWYLIIALPIIFFIMLLIGVKTSSTIAYHVDSFKLKIPIIGPILKKIILTRVTGFFAMMYASGITIIECIRTSEQIAGNRVIELAMHQVGQSIADGETLSNSFAKVNLFPALVLRMIRVGENTGALEDSLKNISYFYTRDIKESIERLQALIEPTMTVILGTIIGWVMFSVLGPIYDLITKIKI